MDICLGERAPFTREAAVTVGNFDGVHIGHQSMLRTLREEAKKARLATGLIIFEPQPAELFATLKHQTPPVRISPLRDKLAFLQSTSLVDMVRVLRFNPTFAASSADNFIRHVLQQQCKARLLVIGDDFRFGANREGDVKRLRQHFRVIQMPTQFAGSVRASSTAIRHALLSGNIKAAEHLMGHAYVLSGRVKHGAKLGHTLDCPTANVHLSNAHTYPLNGIYVVKVWGPFKSQFGVASFGTNPTVSGNLQQKLEVHLFDFSRDIYGARLNVQFLHKLRDERRFATLDALQRGIHQDIDRAKTWLSHYNDDYLHEGAHFINHQNFREKSHE